MAQAKPGTKKTYYNWSMFTDPVSKKKKIYCYESIYSVQFVTSFWETNKLSPFHDAVLARCTKGINAILRNVQKKNKDRKRELSFILFDSRMFLVWAHHGMITPHDDHNKVVKALNLKRR